MKQWYEKLFENYAGKYENESFTKGTIGECDFIEAELKTESSPGEMPFLILDIGCGTGRHAIELASRGFTVTGIDLSESMLQRARENAAKRNVTVEFRQGDARAIALEEIFDGVLMLCEGGFPLMETDEMNFLILRNAARALKPGGKLIFTTLNGLFPLFHSVKEFMDAEKTEGGAETRDNTFDLMTFRDRNITTVTGDDGELMELDCNERYYVPSEITWLLKTLGFRKIDIHGAKIGAFSREDALTTEDYEMLVIGEKGV